ncbi:MAG: DUF975 family protein [Oscillospiraceae bacterium]|nr:DUF975 family protein [Oscillospiraceae bacterium]
MWDRKELKQRGKAAFKANYWKCVLVAILLTLLAAGTATGSARSVQGQMNENDVSFSINQTDTGTEYIVNDQSYASAQDAVTAVGEAEDANPEKVEALNELITAVQTDPEVAAGMAAFFAVLGGVVIVIALIGCLLRVLVFNPLEVGCRSFFTRNTEAPAELSELKTGFRPYGRTVGAMFLRGLFTFLWGLLFIIPGIVKSYSYRMVPYILAEDPDISGKEAITLSRQMMDGQKWKTFVLDLSFLGWGILSCLTLGLLGIFFVNPYKFSTDAELYQALKNA